MHCGRVGLGTKIHRQVSSVDSSDIGGWGVYEGALENPRKTPIRVPGTQAGEGESEPSQRMSDI